MPRNAAFPVDTLWLNKWREKTPEELDEIRSKIMTKMDSIDNKASSNVYEHYLDLLEQLDIVITEKNKAENEQQSQADPTRRSKRPLR